MANKSKTTIPGPTRKIPSQENATSPLADRKSVPKLNPAAIPLQDQDDNFTYATGFHDLDI